ncbi:MAG TPA: hypothetical protein VFJ98_09175 [Mycobacteriales bacterium]|nr:hypothetical protein [Mycobacteriales bacterium]
MTSNAPTWIVLTRDVSDSVQIADQSSTVVGVALDADSGLIVHIQVGTSTVGALSRVLEGALVSPAAPLVKATPQLLVTAPELESVLQGAAAGLSQLADVDIVAAGGLGDAEEIVDGLVGHMEGRDQPDEPPTVDDWHLLYRELTAFTDAAPWQRWSDSDWFTARFELDGKTIGRDCLVLGNAGLQHGFNVVPDADDLLAADRSGDHLAQLEDALIVHLDPWDDTHGMYAAKARRYGWPAQATLVPSLLTVRNGRPADLAGDDAHLLTLALHAVLTQDTRRIAPVGRSAVVTGELALAEGIIGRFEIGRP